MTKNITNADAPQDAPDLQFDGATVLITGGTGSFGNALLDTLLPTKVKEVRIFSRDEMKQDQMRQKYADPRVKFYIGDVRERASLKPAMTGVNCLFHAAALKQVPSCEFFPMQAVLSNVVGSTNVIECAVEHGVGRVVCLSTDKAVYPVNAMGMTKALMEKVAIANARAQPPSGTILSSVRYGNVMCSRGSVIPLFIKQIREGRTLTITVPEMTRFLLPLPQAIELVKFAFVNANQGDLFIRKAPACTVQDLAQALSNLFEHKLPIDIIGIRHGEKIYETLATSSELAKAEDMGDYYRVPMDDRDLNYNKFFTEGDVQVASPEDYHSHNTSQLSVSQVEQLLLTLPEVRMQLQAAGKLASTP